jgi:membrane-associated phospholipid phosphatase
MLTIIKKNLPFFIGFLIFLIAGLVLLLITEKGDAVLYFNNHRSPQSDLFFRYTSKMGEAFPYLTAIAILLFVRFRYALLIPAIGFAVALVSLITKSIFAHNRPSLYFKEMGIFDQINLVEGIDLWEKYSFPSGHTMSAFAIFGFLAFLLDWKKTLGIVMLLLAVLVGISRMYLVQHFLKDVYLGAVLGVLIAMSAYIYQSRFPYNPNKWIDRSLLMKRKKDLPKAI